MFRQAAGDYESKFMILVTLFQKRKSTQNQNIQTESLQNEIWALLFRMGKLISQKESLKILFMRTKLGDDQLIQLTKRIKTRKKGAPKIKPGLRMVSIQAVSESIVRTTTKIDWWKLKVAVFFGSKRLCLVNTVYTFTVVWYCSMVLGYCAPCIATMLRFQTHSAHPAHAWRCFDWW